MAKFRKVPTSNLKNESYVDEKWGILMICEEYKRVVKQLKEIIRNNGKAQYRLMTTYIKLFNEDFRCIKETNAKYDDYVDYVALVEGIDRAELKADIDNFWELYNNPSW